MQERGENMKTYLGDMWKRGRSKEKLAGGNRGNIRRRKEEREMDEDSESMERRRGEKGRIE